MNKRIASLVLAALMVLVSVPVFSLAVSAETAYTYTTSWQKNAPIFKFDDEPTSFAKTERADAPNAWTVGYSAPDKYGFEPYTDFRYSEVSKRAVEATKLNVPYGSVFFPSDSRNNGRAVFMLTHKDAHQAVEYKADYEGAVDISIDSLSALVGKHSVLVLHNGEPIWPANATFADTSSWFAVTTINEDVAASMTGIPSLNVKAGDKITFVFGWTDVDTYTYNDCRDFYDFDASIKYKSVKLADDANIASAVINGQTIYYDGKTNLIKTGEGKTGGQVPSVQITGLPAYFNEDQFAADADAVATYGTFKDYLLAHGHYEWTNENLYYQGWSGGVAYLDKEVGNFSVANRLAYMNKTMMEIAEKWYSQSVSKSEWLVPEDIFAQMVDQYIAGEKPNLLEYPTAAIAAVSGKTQGFEWARAYDKAVVVHQWESSVAGVAQFKNHSDLGYADGITAGSKLCIVIDNEVVFPANATWSTTDSWYDLTDGTNRKAIADIDADLADFRALVNVGSKVQICIYSPTTYRGMGSSNDDYPFRMAYQISVNPVLAKVEDTSVSLGDDLTMNYFVRVANVADGAEVGVVADGVFYAGMKIEEGLYKAAGPAIPAKDAAKEIVVTPAIKTGDVIAQGSSYVGSVAVRLAQYTGFAYDAKTNALARAALNYIGAAQTYFGVEGDNAMMFIRPVDRPDTGFVPAGTYADGRSFTQGKTVIGKGVNISLLTNVSFLLEIEASDAATYTATITDGTNNGVGEIRKVADGQYRVVFADIAPTVWNTNFTMKVTNNADATDVFTITYSVATYAARTASQANVKALTDAMLVYHEAAIAYVA